MEKRLVTIKGISPLLMHRFPLAESEAFEKWLPEAKAEWVAYRDVTTQELYIPGTNLQRSLISAAAYSKGKGRGNLVRTAAAALFVSPEVLLLGVKEYIIDVRIVTNPVTKGRHPRHRPRLDTWQVTFMIEWDETLLTEKQVREIVDNAGQRVGILDFRPEKKGPFGRFMVTEWK